MVVPPKHLKMIIFSRKTHGCLGTTILGNTHIYIYIYSPNWQCIPLKYIANWVGLYATDPTS